MTEKLAGECFNLPRGYGHASYMVVFDNGRDVQNLYFRVVNDHAVIDERHRGDSHCIFVLRLGGYDGPPQRTFAAMVEETQ